VTTSGVPVPTAAPAVVTGQELRVGASNNGAVVTVPVGTEITVSLAAWVNPPYSWTAVISRNPQAIRLRAASQEKGSSTATFTAIATGVGILTATNNPNCLPCGPPSALWQVTIRVD
jgi:hypothetical protein